MPFQIIRNDITKVKADAIVNTANPEPVYGRGTDSSIYQAAGAQELLKERVKIGRIERGEAKATPAFNLDAKYIIHTVGPRWEGGKGGEELAREVVRLCEKDNSSFSFSYELDSTTIEEKINSIVTKIYGGDGVILTPNAKKQAQKLTEMGLANLPICMAKTQYSFSDDQTKLGAPENFIVTVRNIKVSAGAGFIVALTGDIMTMPGLPKSPAAERIDIDENGKITGLF